MKRTISVLLTLCMIAGLAYAGAVFAGAATVPAGYIPIYTLQDLDDIRNDLTGKYILMNDIDMSNWGDWESIGLNESNEDGWDGFSGVFDGNTHKISNLTYSRGDNAAGLFAGLIKKAVVKNLNLIDVALNASYYAGGITVIAMGESSILNCSVSGSITAEDSAGGIVSRVLYGPQRNPMICGCHNSAAVTAPIAGGIIGKIQRNEGYDVGRDNIRTVSFVTRCFNSGRLTGEKTGGLIGACPKWWMRPPAWVQWVLYYGCFGWRWM